MRPPTTRQEAARTPVDSFGHGWHFNVSYGRLWFECGKGNYCQVRVATGSTTTHSGDTREDAAIKLARQVPTRVGAHATRNLASDRRLVARRRVLVGWRRRWWQPSREHAEDAGQRQGGAHYGYGPATDGPAHYQPDVVVIGDGPPEIRSVSGNGLVFHDGRQGPTGCRSCALGRSCLRRGAPRAGSSCCRTTATTGSSRSAVQHDRHRPRRQDRSEHPLDSSSLHASRGARSSGQDLVTRGRRNGNGFDAGCGARRPPSGSRADRGATTARCPQAEHLRSCRQRLDGPTDSRGRSARAHDLARIRVGPQSESHRCCSTRTISASTPSNRSTADRRRRELLSRKA